MFELLLIIGFIAFLGALALFMLKVFFGLLVLPFRVAFWLARGILGLVVAGLLALAFLNFFSLTLPLLLLFVLLPVFLLVGFLVFLVRLVF